MITCVLTFKLFSHNIFLSIYFFFFFFFLLNPFVVQSLSHVWLFVTPGLQHTKLPYPSPSPRVCLNSCPFSQWCHPPTHPLSPLRPPLGIREIPKLIYKVKDKCGREMVTLPLWFGAIEFCSVNKMTIGHSLVVQWLGLCVFTADGMNSIPGQGTKIPQATPWSQKKNKKVDDRNRS